jgi:hypothetical protein
LHPVVYISTHGRKSGATRRIEIRLGYRIEIRLGYADRRIFMALVLSAASDRELDET